MTTRVAAAGPGSSREKILEVAEELFARQGFAGVSLADVASRVGLRKPSLFHHFPGKVALYAEVCEGVLARIAARVRPALDAPGLASLRLERAIGSLIDALAEHRGTARLLLRSLLEDDLFSAEDQARLVPLDRALAELVQSFQELLREGIESGEFRRVSLPDATQTVIGATLYHFASGEFGETLLGGPIFSAEAVARRKREVTAFIRAGLIDETAPFKSEGD